MGANNTKRIKSFEIRADIRWPDINKIAETIKNALNDGLNGKAVKIREDRIRMYLWIDDKQYTGNSI